jgi:hypothetical protein
MEKIQNKSYAQSIYAAICNNRFFPNEIWPLLTEDKKYEWTCSWRGAGGLVAELRKQGEDYMDYYCSGMGGFALAEGEDERHMKANGFVPEGIVTEEVRTDLLTLGWTVRPYDND